MVDDPRTTLEFLRLIVDEADKVRRGSFLLLEKLTQQSICANDLLTLLPMNSLT